VVHHSVGGEHDAVDVGAGHLGDLINGDFPESCRGTKGEPGLPYC
jgi:hypothetical protein